jgi:hypothetical protein
VAVTEKHRHELFNEVERLLGARHAETLMELLPPVGWAEVATKRDLDTLAQQLRAEVRVMSSKEDLHLLRRDMVTWLLAAMGIQTAVIGLLVGLVGG